MMDLTGLKGFYDFEFAVTPEELQTMMIRAAISPAFSCRLRRFDCSIAAAIPLSTRWNRSGSSWNRDGCRSR
jgi:hypothetical protein